MQVYQTLRELRSPSAKAIKKKCVNLIQHGRGNLRRKFFRWLPITLSVFFLVIYFEPYVSAPIWGKSFTSYFRNEDLPLDDFHPDNPGLIKFLNTSFLVRDRYETGFEVPNRDLCPDEGASLLFLLLVPSGRGNFDRRMAIRHTWGHYALRKDIEMAFVLGRAESEPAEVTSRIANESDTYGDIIAGRFIDSHDNNTIKTTFIFDWTTTFCPKVKFLLKIDDDVFMNVPLVIDLVKSNSETTRSLIGPVCRRQSVFRGGPYSSSEQDFPPPIMPDFLHGHAWVITGDIIRELLEVGLKTPFILTDDSLYSGIIAQALNIPRVDVDDYRWRYHQECDVRKDKWIMTGSYDEHIDLWKKHLQGGEGC